MKIIRSSRTSLKFITEKKRQVLYEVMDEYSRLVNLFIEMFWGNEFSKKYLTKEITNLPVSWLTARMRQCAAREALGMVATSPKLLDEGLNGEKSSAHEMEREAIKPCHSGRKMILSAQIVKLENAHTESFDYWLILTSIGQKINPTPNARCGVKLSLPIKSHRHMNLFNDWTRSTTVTIHREYVQCSFEKTIKQKRTTGDMVGIDVGINHLLATSEKELIGDKVKQQINRIKAKKQGSKKYRAAKKTLSYYLHAIVKNYFRQHKNLRLIVVENTKISNKANPKSAEKVLERRSTTGTIENCSTLLRCAVKKTVFPSVASIPIKPVKHVLNVPMLSWKIVLVKDFCVFGVGTKNTLT